MCQVQLSQRWICFVAIAVWGLVSQSLAQQPPSLALTVDASSLAIAGALPKSRVALFGVAREFEAFEASITRYDEVLETDEKGTARFELPEGRAVSPRSVWVAVSLASGELVIGAPEGWKLERVDFPADGLDADRRAFESRGGLLDLLVVRPEAGADGADGAGVWGVRTGDGGDLDRDGEANARISLAFSDLAALSDSAPAPEALQAKDVLVGIEPFSLRIFAGQLSDEEKP